MFDKLMMPSDQIIIPICYEFVQCINIINYLGST